MAPPTRNRRGTADAPAVPSAGRRRAAATGWRAAQEVPEGRAPGVVVVDDMRARRDLIRDALVDGGFEVRGAVSPTQAVDMSADFPVDLVVMDAVRPDVDDMRRRRAFWHGGADPRVMFVGGPREARLSIRLLEIGDDHLAAPYVAEEMVARARAILSRRTPREVARAVTAGRWVLDLRHRTLTGGAQPISLTRTEAAVLAELMERPGAAVSKQAIMMAAWGHDFGRGGGVVETYVSYLRRKFAGAGPHIRTVRSAGYMLDPDAVSPGRAVWTGPQPNPAP